MEFSKVDGVAPSLETRMTESYDEMNIFINGVSIFVGVIVSLSAALFNIVSQI